MCVRIEGDLRSQEADTFPKATRNLFAIHCGRAIVGNIGSSVRMSHTAFGDSVELGWKLRQLNHLYGTRITISGTVRSALGERFWLRRLDAVPLHGGSEQLELFELVGDCDEALPAEVRELMSRYERGLEALRDSDWQTAQSIFDALAAAYPDDRSVRLMKLHATRRTRTIYRTEAAAFSTSRGNCPMRCDRHISGA